MCGYYCNTASRLHLCHFTSWVQNIRREGTGHIGNYQYSNKKIRLKWLSKLQENNERKNTPGVLILSEKLSLS